MTGIILGLVGGISLLAYNHLSNGPVLQNQSQKDIIQDFKKAHQLTSQNHLNSPLGIAWSKGDYKMVRTLLNEKGPKSYTEKMQASIFILDNLRTDLTGKEGISLIQSDIVKYLSSPENSDAKLNRTKNYAAKVLSKLGKLPTDQAKVLENYMLNLKSSADRELYIDYFLTQIPLKKSVQKILEKDILTAERSQQTIIQVALVKDPHAQKELYVAIHKNFKKVPKEAKAQVAKILFTNSAAMGLDLKPLLVEASKMNEPQWQDAFLVGVRALGLNAEFKNRIQQIQNQTKIDSVKLLAHSLLTDVSGVQ